jgi:hypothetical protein
MPSGTSERLRASTNTHTMIVPEVYIQIMKAGRGQGLIFLTN